MIFGEYFEYVVDQVWFKFITINDEKLKYNPSDP